MRTGRRYVARLLADLRRPFRRTHSPARLRHDGYLAPGFREDFDEGIRRIVERVHPFTMTTPERVEALCQAVRFIVRHDVSGAIVECGVWRGGSMMAAALQLLDLNARERELYLFDTYEGMIAPADRELRFDGVEAHEAMREEVASARFAEWCSAPLSEVRSNMLGTGYPAARLNFVVGRVEVTIPDAAPDSIAVLRLDTDWYESTTHELHHLWPRVSPGGFAIIDDYGTWSGARRAVDEFIAAAPHPLFLHRIDHSARLLWKPSIDPVADSEYTARAG
jgi:O-methyltransferase